MLEVAEKLCNKIAIIKNGRLIAAGDMDKVKGDLKEKACDYVLDNARSLL